MPRHERVQLSREELYELAWSKPVIEIAADFGMSSVAFAKHCRRAEVPVPGRGYWQRVEHGHRAKRVPLPKPSAKAPGTVYIAKHPTRPVLAPIATPVVAVSERLTHPHPTLVQLRAMLRTPDGKEGTAVFGDGHPVFGVAAGSKARGLRILDALFKACDSLGATVDLSEGARPHRRALRIRLPDRPAVELWLTERLKRTPHTVTDFDRTVGLAFAPKYDYAHSGELIIEIDAPRTPHGMRRRWMDSESGRLEGKLGDVVVGVRRAADEHKAREDEWARRRKEQEEQRLRQEEADRRQRHLEELGRDLRDMANRWREVETMRSFLKAAELAVPPEVRPSFDTWLGWAKVYVTSLDPLSRPEAIAKRTLHG